MTIAQTVDSMPRKPLRLWPGVIAGALIGIAMFILPVVAPGAGMYTVLGGIAGGLLVLLWWLFFSRAPWGERLGAVALCVAAVFVTKQLVDKSVAGAGMGMLFYMLAIPGLALALVIWAVATRRLSSGPRRAWLIAAVLVVCAAFTALRLDGMSNSAGIDYEWRWTPTAEERLLAEAGDEPAAVPPAVDLAGEPAREDAAPPLTDEAAPESEAAPADTDSVVADLAAPAADADVTIEGAVEDRPTALSVPPVPSSEPEWPGFRGPNRDGVVRGVRIETDWAKSPPVELWRQAVGPGWSSFAVDGDRFFTQEQLGEEELVSCYRVSTGEPVWRHRDATRFWEANAGAGPRATPTLHRGRVYTFGATGILNALDARDGSVVWSRNAATDTGKEVPYWGFASSPVVVDDIVIVAASGMLAGYDLATGEPRWSGPKKGAGYSSPQVATIDGVTQVLLLDGAGAISLSPSTGEVLWQHVWPGDGIVQAAVTEDGDVLIGSGSGMGGNSGLRRVAVKGGREEWNVESGTGGWTTEERWTSTGLKPYFNDFVVHEGHAYGFDGGILAAIDLEDGKRDWKGGRYGDGQLVLLADQDLLLVLSEKGELALVDATPGQFTERARLKVIDSKTWNHPVLVDDIVLVRNSEEMAAFRVPLAGR